jgi:hypothetical protein
MRDDEIILQKYSFKAFSSARLEPSSIQHALHVKRCSLPDIDHCNLGRWTHSAFLFMEFIKIAGDRPEAIRLLTR